MRDLRNPSFDAAAVLNLRGLSSIPVLAILALLAACSSAGDRATSSAKPGRSAETSSERTSGGSNLWEQLDDRRAERRKEAARAVDLQAGAKDLPPGWRDRFEASWKLFLADDRGWPESRKNWIALGPEATTLLVENLIRAYVLAHDYGEGSTYYRVREELAGFKDQAAPYLVEGLSAGKGDDVVRNLCGELLAYFGDTSVPLIVKAYGTAEPKGRRQLVRALKMMKSRAAVPFLLQVAGGSDGFEVRIEAIETLGKMGAKEASPVFQDCLRDSDVSIRKFAASYLGTLGDTSVPVCESLVACMERSAEGNDGEVLRACRRSLTRIVGRDLGLDPRAWRDGIRTGRLRTDG